MPKRSKDRIAGKHFTWNLFARDGVWYADGRHNSPNVGKHSLGTRDRQEALRALHELDGRLAVDLKLAPPPPAGAGGHPEVPIADGWDRYLAHVARPAVGGGANPKTLQRYRAIADKHVRHCAARGLSHWGQVDKRALNEYVTWLSGRGYADGTVYMEGTLVKQVVKWLVGEERALPEANRVRLRLKRSQTSDTYCYSRDEVRAMLDLCQTTPDLQWLADAIVALATTGMRVGELARLRWSDVDLDAGVITLADNRHSGLAKKAGAVRTTKGRRPRRVDVHADLRAVLGRLPHQAEGGHVFRGLKGGPLVPDKVLLVLKRDVIGPLAERFPTPAGEIGFAHGGVHSFRHFFVTEAFRGGATDGEVRDWVGHRDSRIVERYRHLRGRAAKQTMSRLDFLGGEAAAGGPAGPANGTAGNSTVDGDRADGHRSNQLNSGEVGGPNGSGSPGRQSS
jgi:integrase